MIAQSVLAEVKAWALAAGFVDKTEELPLNDMVFDKELDTGILEVWIRYPERKDEFIMIDYSQGYEETIRFAEVGTLAQVRSICETIEACLATIKQLAQPQSANAETLSPSSTEEKSTDV